MKSLKVSHIRPRKASARPISTAVRVSACSKISIRLSSTWPCWDFQSRHVVLAASTREPTAPSTWPPPDHPTPGWPPRRRLREIRRPAPLQRIPPPLPGRRGPGRDRATRPPASRDDVTGEGGRIVDSVGGHTVRVGVRRTGHHREHQGRIGDGAGDRSVKDDGCSAGRRASVCGIRPRRRFEAHHAAHCRRDAHRAGAVGTLGQSAPGPLRRPPRHHHWIRPAVWPVLPRVVGGAVEVTMGAAVVTEFGCVGLARGTARPASFNRVTTVASWATHPSRQRLRAAESNGSPAIVVRPLIENGTPCSGPRGPRRRPPPAAVSRRRPAPVPGRSGHRRSAGDSPTRCGRRTRPRSRWPHRIGARAVVVYPEHGVSSRDAAARLEETAGLAEAIGVVVARSRSASARPSRRR